MTARAEPEVDDRRPWQRRRTNRVGFLLGVLMIVSGLVLTMARESAGVVGPIILGAVAVLCVIALVRVWSQGVRGRRLVTDGLYTGVAYAGIPIRLAYNRPGRWSELVRD